MKRWAKLLGLFALLIGLAVAGFGGFMAYSLGGTTPLQTGEISDGVHAVDAGGMLAFVVEVHGGVVLVDAGMDPEATAIKAKLAELDDPVVLALLLTHGHGDHVGGCGAFPGIPVIAHEAEKELVEGRGSAKGPLPRFMSNDGRCHLTQVVKQGTKVTFGRMQFEAFHLPGHTAGSVAWLGRRVLFLGDAGSAGSDGVLVGALWVFSDDQAQANQSLAGLYDQLPPNSPVLIAPAHSGPIDGLKPLKRFRP